VKNWVNVIQEQADIKDPSIMVLMNKKDLTKKEISHDDMENF
jgi:hypothetical protein